MIKIVTSFFFVGLFCMIASLIYDTTKLTPGHITSLFTVFGVLLGVFGIYDMLITKFGNGLNVSITAFGNNLANAAYEGFQKEGFLGIFTNMLAKSSTGIAGTVSLSFILGMFFKPKD